MQDKIDLAFSKIISTVTTNDMILPAQAKAENEILSFKERRKIIAAFARYVSEGHPGFTTENAPNIAFSDAVKNKFKSELVKMYMQPVDRTVAEMGKELFKFAKKYIPDNHFQVYNTQGVPIGVTLTKDEHATFKQELESYVQNNEIDVSQKGVIEHLYTERNQVGKNLFNDDEISALQQNGAEIVSEKKGQTWRIAEINHQGKNFMMIGMTRFAAMEKNGQLNEDLINDFTNLAKEFSKQEYLNCDALILDLRGNGGGWPYIGDYMARTLYGNTVSTEPQWHIKMDTLSAKLSYAYMEGKGPIERLHLKYESANTKYEQHNRAWSEKYPFNPKLGYKKPILVLTDQQTGSNAELTIGRLREHPYVRTIGDHSCGVVQYHPASRPDRAIPLPYGLKIAVPPEGFSGPNGEKLEGIGYMPDYPIEKGNNALLGALEKFGEIKRDILQNLPVEKEIITSARREAKVDEATSLNLKSIGKSNPSILKAFNELVLLTRDIPQYKNLTAYNKEKVY